MTPELYRSIQAATDLLEQTKEYADKVQDPTTKMLLYLLIGIRTDLQLLLLRSDK